jgi:hypothetical protein
MARDGWRADTGVLTDNEHDPTVAVACFQCARDTEQWPDLIVVARDIQYEDDGDTCEYCNRPIESAYGK